MTPEIVDSFLSEKSIATCLHLERNNALSEISTCLTYGLEHPVPAHKLMAFFKEINFDGGERLAATMVLIRNLNDRRVISFNEIWYSMIFNFTRRDQLTFNFAAEKAGAGINYLKINYAVPNEFFTPVSHLPQAKFIRGQTPYNFSRDSRGKPRLAFDDLPSSYPPVLAEEEAWTFEQIALLHDISQVLFEKGELVEGNYCFTNDKVPTPFMPIDPRRAAKRNLLREFCKNKIFVLEIGFNAGHSSLLVLSSNSITRILAIDIEEHIYSKDCSSILEKAYPERFNVMWGDSRILLWSLDSKLISEIDLVHIDGGHSIDIFSNDLNWCIKNVSIGTTLFVDDAYNQHILELLLELETNNYIKLLCHNENQTQEVRVYELVKNAMK